MTANTPVVEAFRENAVMAGRVGCEITLLSLLAMASDPQWGPRLFCLGVVVLASIRVAVSLRPA